MSEPITLFNPQHWNLLVGALAIQGFGTGDVITLEPPTESVTETRGAMGEVALSVKNNPLHNLKIALHQSSGTNPKLRSLFRSQMLPAFRPFPCVLSNAITGESWRGEAWLHNDAPLKLGEAVQNTEWDFGFAVSDYAEPST